MLLLGGLGVAIVNGSIPVYSATPLAASGSFYALASSGDTLYATSDNGGSVVLEKSSDRGVDWSASPVPYPAVAGGAPWTHSAVAADGAVVVLVASTAGPASWGFGPNGTFPPVSPGARPAGACAVDSLVLLATSQDGGVTWNSTTWVTTNVTIGSIVAGVDGELAAVAWLGESTTCGTSAGAVGALTSQDGAQTWSGPQPLVPAGGSVPFSEGIEMAPETGGILVAFGVNLASGTASALSLWQFAGGFPQGFTPRAQFPAPTSWTLQGSPSTPAYLLTPTYLVPLTSPPYTALPLYQLQADAPSVGQLPNVVALAPTGASTVEVAATTSDGEGVDCWHVDTRAGTVSRSCHVTLGSNLIPSVGALPIVALIDGGGWWIAVGASGPPCGYSNCYAVPGGPSGGGPPVAGGSAGASIGTSVCITGCSSAAGLAAYSYDEGATVGRGAVDGVALLLATAGAVGLAILAWVGYGRMLVPLRRGQNGEGLPAGTAGSDPAVLVRRRYRESLLVWVVAWAPLALLAFAPGAGTSVWMPVVIVLGGTLGAAGTAPLHHTIRARVVDESRSPGFDFLGSGARGPGDPDSERVRIATSAAYASWLVGALIAALALVGVAGGLGLGSGAGGGLPGEAAFPSAGGLVLGSLIVLFLFVRIVYHLGLAASVAAAREAPPDDSSRARFRRTQVGAALLTLNPLAGLLLGWAIQPVLPGGPYALGWVFLPVTLLGIGALSGLLGPTWWSAPAERLAQPG